MPIWQAIVLGVVQGLTEFLPISSTAHLLLVQEWLGRTREELKSDPITVVIQLGTLVAVCIYFRKELSLLLGGLYRDLFDNRIVTSASPEGKLAKQVLVATVPALAVGAAFSSKLKEHFYNPPAIAVVSIVFALLMLASEVYAGRRRRNGRPERDEWSITWWDAIFVGLFQACALMPGGSRSGTTLTACLFLGLARPSAARFSFFMSVPAIAAAGMKDLAEWVIRMKSDVILQRQAGEQLTNLIVGTLVSFGVGYLSIAWLMRFLQRYSTGVFVAYRLLLAGVILALVASGFISW
ncbi:undecaprenyl-diphosphatase UppP [Limnoglobus roseus]|uniref:Undecaprenyl-diphosphatase n=1 Tax=Limnoglobus roseus TaxID=2598579 RepID=A0A5C1AL58_9BACT|nr:undecaprenyl-diphosphatase UppP [Limnoglobus roseus]QEL19971.1 undecaprenyl-diphosphatase UppP [Limnoglobus roseus]